jgi:protein TonB
MALYYALPAPLSHPFWRRCLSFGSLASLQGLGLLLAFSLAVSPDLIPPLPALTVRMLEIVPVPAPAERPKPKPAAPLPRKITFSPPVMTVAVALPTVISSFAVAAQPEISPAENHPLPPALAPALAPIIAARFDADYLQNPKPIYPSLSRRLGEEGKVVLRVRVSAQGASLNVALKQSSGYLRLDEAARAAVEQWRFVPARQGSEALESTVLVPLHFALER